MKRLIPLFIFAQLVSLGRVAAEPTPSVSWLMNEPASLFDIGMMRMRQNNHKWWIPELMEEIAGSGLKLWKVQLESVEYSWDDNEITISVYLLGPPKENICSQVLAKYKNKVIAQTGKTFGTTPEKLRKMLREWAVKEVTSHFHHVNYTTKRRPKDLDENLLKIIVFVVVLSEAENFGGDTLLCKNKLFEDTPTYVKPKGL